MNRRTFLKSIGVGASAIGITASGQDLPSGEILYPVANPNFNPDVDFELIAHSTEHLILSDQPSRTWSYSGSLLKGRSGTLTPTETYLGPTIRVRRGDKVRVRFRNELPEPSIVHWHGLTVPELMDGHPRFAIPIGRERVYEFEVIDRAGQYWYHPHPHQRTGVQVYRGMAGLFIVEDDEESSLNLPSGDYEIPLVLQDRNFDSNHQLQYIWGHMEAMTGFLGDAVLVNGVPNKRLSLGTATYRFRVLNGSNSRIYKLAWDDRTPVTLIGSDGGLLEHPVQKPYLTLGPAERADLLLDLSHKSVGSSLELRSLPFSGAESRMGGMGRRGQMGRGRMGRGMGRPFVGGLAQGAGFPILRIQIDRKDSSSVQIPERLSRPGFRRPEQAHNHSSPRVFAMWHRHMTWFLNGATFEMLEVFENEVVKSSDLEIWEFDNSQGGMMRMPHPMHLHGGQFQVLERGPRNLSLPGWQSISSGLTDEGWKDTVLVWPGERVRILMRFPSYKGLFLYHCHNLEHEDLGMMRNFRIT